jgi:2'-5' RNA ligase
MREKRARFMIERYNAPYIFNQFHPHFTLLSGLRPGDQGTVFQNLEQAVRDNKIEDHLHVDKVAVMTKSPGSTHWTIDREIPLG